MPEILDTWSLVAVYSATVVYFLSFFMFVLDLAKRSSQPKPLVEHASATAVSGSTAVMVRAQAPPRAHSSRAQRIGVALAIVGWAVHIAATVLRGVAAERVPWANMYEFALTGTAVIVGVFLVAQLWKDLRFLGAFIVGLVILFLMLATLNYYVGVVPLHPALQSAWLVIHVFAAAMGTGFFAIGTGLSVLQLLQGRPKPKMEWLGRLRSTLPTAEKLESFAYRLNVVGFVLWTFTLICGAIWAERAWGRYWGWDTKEVWTFVIWVVFAGYIHARATRGWRGSRSAILGIIGFATVLFNFVVVNTMFTGLHAYSGL